MTDSRRPLVMLAGLGSAGALLGALAFQYIGGMYPCQLCMGQRWPHLAAVVIALIWLKTRWAVLPWLGALAALTTAGIGLFHAGVEQDWWQYISTCTQGDLGGLSARDLLDVTKVGKAPIPCDAIQGTFLGLSMPAWNAITATGLAAIWLLAALRKR